MSRARDVVEVIAKALVDDPQAVRVEERVDDGDVCVELTSRPGDLGRLIGRRGRTASAVRTLAEIASERDGLRVTVDFLDDEG